MAMTNAERRRRYYAKHKDNPEFKAKRRARANTWYQEHKDNPEYKANNLARALSWKANHPGCDKERHRLSLIHISEPTRHSLL